MGCFVISQLERALPNNEVEGDTEEDANASAAVVLVERALKWFALILTAFFIMSYLMAMVMAGGTGMADSVQQFVGLGLFGSVMWMYLSMSHAKRARKYFQEAMLKS